MSTVKTKAHLMTELTELRQRVTALEVLIATYEQRESALYESENRLHTVLTHAPIILWSVDDKGIITFAAGKGLSVAGLTPNQVVGHAIETVYQNTPQIKTDIGRVLQGDIFTSALGLKGLTFEMRYAPVLNQDDQVIGATILAVDVTERQLMTELLAQSEERHRAAAELTSDYAYAFRIDPNGDWVNEWVTGSFAYITGFTMAEVEARGGWSRLVHPDDVWIIQHRRQAVLKGEARLCEFRIITKTGQERWVQDHARPVWDEAEGRTIRIYGAALDITDRKRAEQALQKAQVELERRVADRTAELAEANSNLRQEIQERQQLQTRLAAIHQLGRELTLMRDETSIIRRALKTATDLLSVDFAAYGLVDQTDQTLEYRYRIIDNGLEPIGLHLPLKRGQGVKGIGVAVVCSSQALMVPDTQREPRYIFTQPERAPRSALCVPLRVGRQITGVLTAESKQPHHFIVDDQQLLQTLADQTAVALENARLYTETRQRLDAQIALRQAGAAIFSTLDVDMVLNQIAEQIGRAINATSVYIGSYEAETLHSTILAEYIDPAASPQERASDLDVTYNLSEVFPATVERFQTGQSWVIYPDSPELSWAERDHFQHFGGQAIMIIPLKIRGQLIAYAEIWESRHRREFSQDEIALCQDIAQQAVVALENARLHTETERRAKQLSVLHELDQAITACFHIDDVYDAFARHTIRLINYDYLSILLLDEQRRQVAYTVDDTGDKKDAAHWLPERGSAINWVLDHGKPLLRHAIDRETDFVKDETLVTKGIRSMLVLPLRVKGQVSGVWSLGSQQAEIYTVDDLQIAQSMADQLAIAIDNARLFESEQLQRRRIEALQAAGAAVSSTLDLNQVLDRLLTELGRVIAYDSASVFLVEEGQLRMTMAHHLPNSTIIGDFFQPNALARRIEETRQPLIIADVQQDPRFQIWGNNDHMRGWMGIPLLVRDQFIGYFTLDSRQPAAYTQTDATLALSFANHAAIAVENARLYQHLQNQMQVLQEAQAQLVRSEKMAALGRLSAAIAHEINNPLQAIKNVLLLFREELENSDQNADRHEKLQDYLNITGQEIERISTITNRMRNFYRPVDRDKPTTRPPTLATIDEFYRPAPHEVEWIELQTTLEDVLKLVAGQLRQQRVTLYKQWADDLPAIQGNANHLKQVFLNLILNAIEGMEGQGGTLYLSGMLDQAPLRNGHLRSVVRVEFSDTGAGIAKEAVPHLFEPFFSTKKQGSGLGLFISHKIIEAHSGYINVESQVGLGTTFSVILPLEQPGNNMVTNEQELRS